MTEPRYKLLTYLLLAVTLFLTMLALSCRVPYHVTDHKHLGKGLYYYQLNDSIDKTGYDAGLGEHKCKKVLMLRKGFAKRIKKYSHDTR